MARKTPAQKKKQPTQSRDLTSWKEKSPRVATYSQGAPTKKNTQKSRSARRQQPRGGMQTGMQAGRTESMQPRNKKTQEAHTPPDCQNWDGIVHKNKNNRIWRRSPPTTLAVFDQGTHGFRYPSTNPFQENPKKHASSHFTCSQKKDEKQEDPTKNARKQSPKRTRRKKITKKKGGEMVITEQ